MEQIRDAKLDPKIVDWSRQVAQEFNRVRVVPLFDPLTLDIGAVAHDAVIETVTFDVRQPGATVLLTASIQLAFTAVAASGTAGVRFQVDAEANTNFTVAQTLVTSSAAHSLNMGYQRTFDVAPGTHTVKMRGIRNFTRGITAYVNYRLELWVPTVNRLQG